jgi:hypothetical protein
VPEDVSDVTVALGELVSEELTPEEKLVATANEEDVLEVAAASTTTSRDDEELAKALSEIRAEAEALAVVATAFTAEVAIETASSSSNVSGYLVS